MDALWSTIGSLLGVLDDSSTKSVVDQWKLCRVIKGHSQSFAFRKEYQFWRMRYRWHATLDRDKLQDTLEEHINIGQIRMKNFERRAYSSRPFVNNSYGPLELDPRDSQDCVIEMGQRVVCRICREGDNLVQPCLCRGSVGYVHVECLKMWAFSSSNQNPSRYLCELCHCPYHPTIRNLLKDAEPTNLAETRVQGAVCQRPRWLSCTPAHISALIISFTIVVVTAVLLTLVLSNSSKS
jgi:hypothetical protein